ncbi:hypothetical protein SEA_ACOLYTE_69 [Mycobacterium phage Acolyte]|nr:hypothetical protein SEA_ACOLYTE_69 [Mycobacterium phage Acolyte]
MFPEGTEVVDRELSAEGHAAVGIVLSGSPAISLVEWPDGLTEYVFNEELVEA